MTPKLVEWRVTCQLKNDGVLGKLEYWSDRVVGSEETPLARQFPRAPSPQSLNVENAPERRFEGGLTRMRLPFAIWKEFAVVGDHHPVALGIGFFLNVDLKIDGAHDAVAEHLVDERLHRRTVNLGDFVKPVD